MSRLGMEELACYFRARSRTALWLAVSPASVYGEGKLAMTHKRSSTDQYLRVFFHTVGCSLVQIEDNPEHILDQPLAIEVASEKTAEVQ